MLGAQQRQSQYWRELLWGGSAYEGVDSSGELAKTDNGMAEFEPAARERGVVNPTLQVMWESRALETLWNLLREMIFRPAWMAWTPVDIPAPWYYATGCNVRGIENELVS